jgi:hypothetical protein
LLIALCSYLTGSCSIEQIRSIGGKCKGCRDNHRNPTIQKRVEVL